VAGAELTCAWLAGKEPAFVRDGEDPEIPEEAWEPDFPLALQARPSGADGWLDVRGVPWLQGERVRVVVASGDRQAGAGLMLVGYAGPRELAVRLPDAANCALFCDSAICVSGSCGCFPRRKAPEGDSTLLARVTTRDGQPARGVRVDLDGPVRALDYADADGVVMFERLPAGAYTLGTHSVGFTAAEARLDLRAGELHPVELAETAGWTARLQVVDAEGIPVPGAGFTADQAHSVAYLPCRDGVQDLALLTDSAGGAVLEHVSPGPLEVRVTYGSRSAGAELQPGSAPALIRLPPPE